MKRRQNCGIPRNWPAALAAAVTLVIGLGSEPKSGAAVKAWNGGTSGNWSLPANWAGNSAPTNGDQLVFPSTAIRFTITNDVANLKLDSITFDTGSGYDIRGNAITLTNGLAAQQSGSASDTIELAITNAASQTYSCVNPAASLVVLGNVVLGATTLNVTNAGSLTVGGVISGTGAVVKGGPGTLTYNGSAANTYSGSTMVNAGVLALAKTGTPAIAGPLVIGGDVDAQAADVVRLLAPGQIDFGSAVTVSFSGLLDLNGFNNTIGSLTLLVGKVTTGSGTLGLLGPVNVGLDPVTNLNVSVITGKVTLSSAAQNFVISNSADCILQAAVVGSGGLFKLGGGSLELYSSNSYSGLTVAAEGILLVGHSFALGATNSGTVVSNAAQIKLRYNSHVGNEALTLNGAGPSGDGAMVSDIGTNSWAGPITLATNCTISSFFTPSELILSNAISGPGSLIKIGDRPLVFAGTDANTYAGVTLVNAGTLILSKSVFDGSIPGDLSIGPGTAGCCSGDEEVRLTAPNQIVNSSALIIGGTGLLNLNGNLERIGSFAGDGDISLGAGALIVGDNNRSGFFGGVISGSGALTKVGTGVLSLSGNNTYTGLTTVSGGILRVDGTQGSSPVTIGASGVLSGSGSVGIITNIAGGTVAPSLGDRLYARSGTPATLTCAETVFAGAGSTYAVELAGPTPAPSFNLFPATGYDQLLVNGSNSLGGATLRLHLSFGLSNAPALGDQFVLINNQGANPIAGTFNGLPNGSAFTTNGLTFRINYDGGNGNDVVLTLTNIPAASAGSVIFSASGAIGPNECALLEIIVSNRTASAMTGVTGLLSSATPGVTVLQSASSYPDVPAFGTATNTIPFQLSTAPFLACSNSIQLGLALQTATSNSFVIPVTLPVGTCVAGSGLCALCPDVSLSTMLGSNTPTQSGRLNSGVASLCGAAKTCPGVLNSFNWRYDTFTFGNGSVDACLTATLSAPTATFGVSAAAYLGGYDPANQCSNYLADLGGFVSFSLPSATFSFVVPSNATFIVVVFQVAGTAATPYTLAVTGSDCRPALNISRAATDEVALDWTTAAPGFVLEMTNNLTAAAPPSAWPAVSNVPVAVTGRFRVTNSIAGTNQFFRLHKP